MPDTTPMSPTHRSPALGWGETFAALPLETPDSDAWQHLQQRRSHRARMRWPAWLASAAALALAAVLPWQLQREPADAPAPTAQTPAIAPAAQPIATTAPAGDAKEPKPALALLDEAHRSSAPDAVRAVSRIEPRQSAPDTRPAPRQTAAVAARGDVHDARPETSEANLAPPQPASAPDRELERLYAESARLETLVALARDDRVATGAAATLTSAYDAQVASIDASLRGPDVDATQRTALWQQRVDALRQLAGFESTQRMLAAQGERYDAMLVSID